MNCAVKSSAVPKVTQSRNFNCTNLRILQHTLDLTAQLLTVQLKLKVKLNVCVGPKRMDVQRDAHLQGFICSVTRAKIGWYWNDFSIRIILVQN